MSMLGIDTSHWKGDIVNTNVAIDFVYTKATEGNYYVDDTCDPIVEWAKARGKKWGVYHFATNQKTDAITEANYFVDNCLGYIGNGIIMLDYENYKWGDGSVANVATDVKWALQWLNHVFSRTGVRPMIYMSASVVNEANWQPVIDANYGLWVAAYPLNNTRVSNYQMDMNLDPNPKWGDVGNVGWQFTSSGVLNGYGGVLDCNVFYGTPAAWDAYARSVNAAPTPAPEPPAPDPVPTPVTEPTPPPVFSTEPIPVTESTPDPVVIPPSTETTEVIPAERPYNVSAIAIRVFSTFYQAFIGVISAAIVTGIPVDNSAILALLGAAVAAGVSAVKNLIVKPQEKK